MASSSTFFSNARVQGGNLAKKRYELAIKMNFQKDDWLTEGQHKGQFRFVDERTGLIHAEVPLRGEMIFNPEHTQKVPPPKEDK